MFRMFIWISVRMYRIRSIRLFPCAGSQHRHMVSTENRYITARSYRLVQQTGFH